MPLTELIIDGFKSFAEKTTIHFGKGITGIVGPNGSGKSNITEAIRWTMGETRAKTLRGTSMKDVIFAGSEFRKPLNRAQVTLVFNNHDHKLNYQSDQVAITRRILRSGDSEYLINNQSVRLKDVRALFLDSGISQNSLAIISQGRVDQILNSHPEERRVIFEEAAGVLHFKQQKEIAQAQLSQTTDNLIRINDLVKELAGRIEPLHEQSSLAKEYQFQKNELDQKLKTLLAFEIQELGQNKAIIESKSAKNQALLDKLDTEVKESSAAVAQKRDEYQQLHVQQEDIQKNLLAKTQQLSELNTKIQVAEQSKRFDAATKLEYQNQSHDLEKQLADLQQELADCTIQEKKLTEKQTELEKKRTSLTDKLHENPEKLAVKLDSERNNYIQLLQDQTSNNNELTYLRTELKKAVDDQSYQNNDVVKQLQRATDDQAELKKQGQQLNDSYQTKSQQLQQLKTELQTIKDELINSRQAVTDIHNQLQQLTARRDALINIQKRHEGYYYGVKNVLNHPNDYPGIIGVVGELISFPIELEAALTTALGAGVQNLITDTQVNARDAIKTLKNTHSGRATFLPLNGLKQYQIPQSTITALNSFSGFRGIASTLVTSNAKVDLTPAINYLLGSIIIVDNIDTALAISRRINRYRIVTLDGDVISPGGSMTGGVKNQRNNSPLQIATEINKLSQKIKVAKDRYDNAQNKFTDLSAKNETLTVDLTTKEQELQKVTRVLSEATISYQNQVKEVKRLTAASELYNSRLKARERTLVDLKAKIVTTEEKQTDFEKNISSEKQRISDLQTQIKNFNNLNQQVQRELAILDPQIAVFVNKLENIRQQKADKNRLYTNSKNQLANINSKLSALTQNHKLSSKNKAEFEEQITILTNDKTKLELQLNELSEKLGQFDAQINQLDQVASRNYDLRKAAADEQEELSIKITKFNSIIDQKLKTLSADYSLTYEAALTQTQLENTQANRLALAKSVKLHRMSLEDIGSVNLDAIKEYEEVKQRYDFLNTQQNDLLSARKDLEASMAELDKEVKARFSVTFKTIATSFSKIFPVVFNGGNAKLVLTNPDDMLTTGIEIIAQPPGKKLQRLSLLSGGERALTAITLLFAMLQVNPVPFCVLDEVEAALDDANVTRFAEFLQKYDLHTQFIVITHRRGTMTKANRLFGVVMQESGVSQVLSVSLEDIKNEVK